MKPSDRIASSIPDEALEAFISLGRQLAAQMAEESFMSITAVSSWDMSHVEAATELSIERMQIAAHDVLVTKGVDPNGELWQEIWTAMETGYRETMAILLKTSGRRSGEVLQ